METPEQPDTKVGCFHAVFDEHADEQSSPGYCFKPGCGREYFSHVQL